MDDEILVDGMDVGPFNHLQQPWTVWARTALGYATDRISALENTRQSNTDSINQLKADIQSAYNTLSTLEAEELVDDITDDTLSATIHDLLTRISVLEVSN